MMSRSSDARAIAKLAWEAAWERLGNALQPPPGYPEPTPEQLRECFRVAQEQLDSLGEAHGIAAPHASWTSAASPMIPDCSPRTKQDAAKRGYIPERESGAEQ